MKKEYLIFIICVLTYSFVRGQKEKIELIGTLETETAQLISLKLSFTVDEHGVINGTSTTDFYGANRTVSVIKGNLNLKNQRLSFKEIANVNTRSDAKASEFCYIEVNNLSIKRKNEKSILNGKFKGYFPNGEPCANGRIYLVGANVLENLIETEIVPALTKKLEAKEDTSVQRAQNIRRAINPTTTLKGGGAMAIDWQSNVVRLDVWDSYQEDNDRINIYVDGQLVHANLEVKEQKQSFTFPFIKETLTLRIEAENEGTNPPNTVNAQLIDNGKIQPLVTRLNKKQSVTVTIKK